MSVRATIERRPPAPIVQGWARVYLDAEPEQGSHRGFQGYIRTDERGVTAPLGFTEWLWPEEGQHDSEWFELEHETFVPWNRVWQIDWLDADPREASSS